MVNDKKYKFICKNISKYRYSYIKSMYINSLTVALNINVMTNYLMHFEYVIPRD